MSEHITITTLSHKPEDFATPATLTSKSLEAIRQIVREEMRGIEAQQDALALSVMVWDYLTNQPSFNAEHTREAVLAKCREISNKYGVLRSEEGKA